ncbi:hypothetical protein CAEBREN_03368 [Caenorhabditis brenneri]|uniref:Uncharacterized protein n=1 Tax=Caenorhabditis brenneri TaxID=135651 RepID=G0MQN4_CAEBE|nr:hypothetical protein CAEBREN_03368 [Caenorhabditis brenneri]
MFWLNRKQLKLRFIATVFFCRLALRIYIILIWICSLFFKLIVIVLLYAYMKGRQIQNMERFHNKLCYWGFGILAVVTLIYLALFINLYKIPRQNKWNRPEVALLYEGIPLLLVNMFILYFIRYFKAEGHLPEYYYNYEMRRIVITTALVQFTFVFTFEKIWKFFSTDLKVYVNRSSFFTPIVAPERNAQQLNQS